MYMRTYSVLLYKCPCICIAYEFIVFWVFFFNIPQLCAMQYNAAGGKREEYIAATIVLQRGIVEGWRSHLAKMELLSHETLSEGK